MKAPPACASLCRLAARAAANFASAANAGIVSSQSSTAPSSLSRARGKGPSASAQARSSRCTASRRGGGDRDPLFGHDLLEGGQPGRIGRAVAQQPRPLAQRMVIGGDARAMRRVEPEHEPVEKSPAAARSLEKQAVHLRGQPQHAQPLGKLRLAARRLAVDPHDPALAAIAPSRPVPMRSGPRRVATIAATAQPRAGGVPSRSTPPIDFAELGAAQTAPRREKGHCLQQIGLAGSVGAGQHDRLGAEVEPGLAIVAEIGQHEPRHADASRRGTGIAAGSLCLGKHGVYMGTSGAFSQLSLALPRRQMRPRRAHERRYPARMYFSSRARQRSVPTASSRSWKVARSPSMRRVSPSSFSAASTFCAARIAARWVCDG